MKKKKGEMSFKSTIIVVIILIALMALMLVIIFMSKSKGVGAIEYVKNLFRFGASGVT